MRTLGVVLRPARHADLEPWLELYEAVAAEGGWIAGEAPVDRPAMRQRFMDRFFDGQEPQVMLLATAAGGLVGTMGLRLQRGVVELGMMVAADWRGRGVGSMLMEAGLAWSADAGAHKVALQLWPHNAAARRLYEKFGFVEEGYLRRHYRRRNGELWDAVVMGLLLEPATSGSA